MEGLLLTYHPMTLPLVLAVGLALPTTDVGTDASVQMLREYGESMNLQRVILKGIVHLAGRQKQELGGNCGGTAFLLEDTTGSIEISVRRSSRLLEPLREGDRVRVIAQVDVIRNKDNVYLRTCVMANDVEHLDR